MIDRQPDKQPVRRLGTTTRWTAAALLVALLGAGAACSGPKVKTDYDPGADFSSFRTYAFAGMTDVNQGGVLDNSLIRKRIEGLIAQELSNKGLRQVPVEADPDLLVHYWVGLQEKQRVEGTGPTVGMYGRRGAYGGGGYGWGAGYSGVSTYEYTEGTLIVDLVTPAKKELVWRGSVVGTLDDSKEKNIEMVREGLAKAFADYPPKVKP